MTQLKVEKKEKEKERQETLKNIFKDEWKKF